MTDTTLQRPAYKPRFHRALKRAVPTTGIGTVRLAGGPLVPPDIRAFIENGTRDVHISIGEGITQLCDHAKATNFKFQPIIK